MAEDITNSIFYNNNTIGNAVETLNIKQIYAVLNDAAKQAFGGKAIAVLDTQSFVSLGTEVMSTDTNVDAFFGALTMMCARTIISERLYKSQYDILELSNEQYGLWVRKIRFKMPEATADDSVSLENGKSVDMYVVNKPATVQKVFAKIGTWEYYITLQRKWMQLAFESESMMGRFFSALMTWVYNRMAGDNENLAKMALSNFVANIAGGTREIKLLTMYNTEMGLTGSNALTVSKALLNESFLRYAMSTMQLYADYMRDMGVRFNDGTVPTFTPDDRRITLINTLFENRLKTQMLYAAFHESYLRMETSRSLSYWQSPNSPMKIVVQVGETVATDGTKTPVTKTVENVVGVMFDRDALGTYRKEVESLTTPINARGRYVNTFWFVDYQPINDLSENGIVFTLN